MSFYLEGEKVVQNFHVGFQCTGPGLIPLPPFLAVILTPVTSIIHFWQKQSDCVPRCWPKVKFNNHYILLRIFPDMNGHCSMIMHDAWTSAS